MASSGFFAQLLGLFLSAIADAREKVVEEGWFGRPTGPHEPASAGADPLGRFAAPADHDPAAPTVGEAPRAGQVQPPTWTDYRAGMAPAVAQPEHEREPEIER